MSVSNKDFYEDVRPTLMLYKIIGITSLKNVFYGRLDFQWGSNLIWPVVCIILCTIPITYYYKLPFIVHSKILDLAPLSNLS